MRRNTGLALITICLTGAITYWLTPRGNLFPEPLVSDFAQFLSRGFYVAFLALALSSSVFGPLTGGESRWHRFLFVLAVVLLATGVEAAFEAVWWDPRPRKNVIPGKSSGFPSGHATCAFAAACLVASLFPRWAIAAFVSALLVGYSRVETTSHFPHQVVAGATFGSMAALWCALGREKFLEKRLAARESN